MSLPKRILVAVAILIVLAGVVLALDAWRGKITVQELNAMVEAGEVPVYLNGELVAAFAAEDLSEIQQIQFTDQEEGKVQEGWLVSSIFEQYFKTRSFSDLLQVTFTSSSRDKSITLTWEEINNPENMVMFDLSGRGTLKLVSVLEKLDTRDEWIQDVDKIEVIEP